MSEQTRREQWLALPQEEKMRRTLNGFVWLEDNLHQYGTPEWKEMFESAMKDAHEALAPHDSA